MTEPVRVGSLRGIMMRGPGVSATLPFYEDMWGLSLSHQEDGLALLRGTGTEPFLYGLKDGPVFGIEYVHFAMPDRASMDALHAQIMAKGHAPISAPAAFDDWVGGYGFETLDPDNDALRHELTAVSQFWLHYRLLQNWGFGAMADKWRHESIEEMEHADELIARIVFLEGAPNLQKLDPLMIGDTIREVLDADLKAEYRARALYREGRDAAEAAEDHVTKLLFETLMSDEEGHIDFLETEIDLFDRIGEAEYGVLNGTPADEAPQG